MRAKLTQALINGTQPKGGGQVLIWDTEVRGFGVRITRGARTFVLQYNFNGKDNRFKLGSFAPGNGGHNLEQARKLAAKKRLELLAGGHPAEEIRQARKAPSVSELAERFQAEHAVPKCKPSTAKAYAALWKRCILPRLGEKRVPDVTSREITQLHHAMRDTPTAANRVVALLRKAFGLAARWGWYPENRPNPARGHDAHPEKRRGRALTTEQLAAIGTVLAQEGLSIPAAAFLLPLLTGCRPGEALNLRWADIQERLWYLEDAKTGSRIVYLGSAAVRMLEGLPRVNEWVFPGRLPGRPLESTRKLWLRVRKAAGLPDSVRPYDATRHTFATICEELGIERERRKVLAGHATDRDITERYIHRRPESLLADADRVSEEIAAALEERGSRNTIPTPSLRLPSRAHAA
jgi:integrase